jgi:hypothetical protein
MQLAQLSVRARCPKVVLVAEPGQGQAVRIVAHDPAQEVDGAGHDVRVVRMVEDALIGGLEELPLALVAARVSLPGGEQVAQTIDPVWRLDAVPPVGTRRRRREHGDELALPRLAPSVAGGALRLGALVLEVPRTGDRLRSRPGSGAGWPGSRRC